MASSCQPHDLESGPERIPGFGDPTQSSSAETSSSPVRSAGSTVVVSYRPSKEWARSMEAGEKNLGKLPFAIPKKENWDVERWRQFRWLYSGEKEVDIWKRIRQQYIAQRPWWHSLCPFWRPVLLGEREILLHSQEGIIFKVEIEPALDLQEEQKKADSRFNQAAEELEKYMPDEYCCYGEFDVFGEWFSKYHDSPPCRKGIPIDDYREHDCDLEIFVKRKSERDRMKREYDFMECFQNPSKADTVFPLTTGRVLDTCIHDRRVIRNYKLPSRNAPNRLPPSINGLVIEYHFSSTRTELEIVTSSLFVGAVVLTWKLATGDWNVAAAFGGLCVALMTLGHQRSQTLAGKKAKNTKND